MKTFVKLKKQKVVSKIVSLVLDFVMCVGILPVQTLAKEMEHQMIQTKSPLRQATVQM